MLSRIRRTQFLDRLIRRPRISVVVVVHNIPRQARRTLLSLSPGYQRHIGRDEYEVIVVDNGSTPPLDETELRALNGPFRLIRLDPAPPSPARALRLGLEAARGEVIGAMIDGARIVTPGLLHFAFHGAQLYEKAVVATLGWYVGADLQRWSMQSGHNAASDDRLLDSIGWPGDGYRLFEIGTMDESSIDGWVQPIAESNALFLKREMWEAIGGIDERFDMPGGGCLNLHLLREAMDQPGARLVILAGEGTFHQFHGGIATNAPWDAFVPRVYAWLDQYEALTHRKWEAPTAHDPPTYIGVIPRPALAHFVRAVECPVGGNRAKLPELDGPFTIDAEPPSDPAIAALLDLAEEELRAGRLACAVAVARMGRSRAPESRRLQRLLSVAGPGLSHLMQSDHGVVALHVALGQAHRLLGQDALAASEYLAALELDERCDAARLALAQLKMPGPGDAWWIEQIHSWLAPHTVVEIGTGRAPLLAKLQPLGMAMVVDPSPVLSTPLPTNTHVFAETSERFFAERRLTALLDRRRIDLAIVSGPRLFEQALSDVSRLAEYCSPRSLVLVTGTVPLDEPTQRTAREAGFHTGDLWKIVLCLRTLRPDLQLLTIPAPPSGLTVIAGLGTRPAVFDAAYHDVVARYLEFPYHELRGRETELLNLETNDPATVEPLLRAYRQPDVLETI